MTGASISKYLNLLRSSFTLLVLYALAGFYAGNIALYSEEGPLVVSQISWKVAALLAFFLWCLTRSWVQRKIAAVRWPSFLTDPVRVEQVSLRPTLFAWGLVCIILSDYMKRRFMFFALYSSIVSRWSLLGAGIVLSAALVLCARKQVKQPLSRLFSVPVLLLVQLLLLFNFRHYVHGRLIFSDDHPSFLYRLQLLMSQFPHLPFYDPRWNAGVEARDFFSTGALSIFFLSWPVLRLWGDFNTISNARIYSYLIPYLFVCIVPWTVFFASRALGFARESAVLSAMFALGPSLAFFEWMLKFGTMAFALSAGLSALALALVLRIAISEIPPRWVEVFAGLVVTSLCLMWTLSILILVPVVAYALISFRYTFARERRFKIFALLALFILLNGPWIYVWVREANVLGFLERSSLPGSNTQVLRHAKAAQVIPPQNIASATAVEETPGSRFVRHFLSAEKKLRDIISSINPLIFFFFIPGLLSIRKREYRIAVALTLVWLFAVAALADFIKPQLDLRRMAIHASFLMATLSGAGVFETLKCLIESIDGAASRWAMIGPFSCLSVIFGTWAISPVNVADIYRNSSDQKYVFAAAELIDLTHAIQQFGGQGRTMFLGFVLHELESSGVEGLDGGHLAPLARFTGRSLYASHFMHARWSAIDPIPKAYRDRHGERVEEFLDLMNVTSVATFRREWRRYCQRLPQYKLVFTDNKIWVYSRQSDHAGYFMRGSGDVISVNDDRVEVIPQEQESVLKFRFEPQLLVAPSKFARLEAFPVYVEDIGGGGVQEVSFVKLIITDEDAIKRGTKFSFGYRVADMER